MRALVAAPGRWPRVLVAVACALILGMYLSNHDMGGDPDSPRGDGKYRPVLARGDGHMLYLMARSTALDGDWVFDNDLARFGDPWRAPVTKTGRKSIIHPVGPALVWTPLIWIAELGAVIANVFGADIQLHGYTLWHQRFVFLSSALFGFGAVLLGRRLARRVVGGAWAPSYAAAAVLLGTSLTYYATYMPSYSHAMDSFACAAFLCYWGETVGRRDWRRWVVLGVLLGIAALVRVQELAMGIVVALEIGVEVVKRPRQSLRWIAGGALALAVAMIVFVPQLVEWQLVFGSITELPQGKHYTRMNAPMIPELLWSSRNGWFTTTPIAYACVIGLGWLVARRRGIVVGGLVAVVVLQVYLNSTIQDWWGSAAFGQRRLCNVTLPLVVGLAALLSACGRLRVPIWVKHGVAAIVLGGFALWNVARVNELRSGASAPADLAPSHFAPDSVRGWVYDRVGNPLELPASLAFAIWHGVPMARWDRTVGNYPLMPPLDTLVDDSYLNARGEWKINSRGLDAYMTSGWGDVADKVRWTASDSATVLVPNLMPESQKLTLHLRARTTAHAVVRFDGDVVAESDLTDRMTPVSFVVDHMPLHTNELTIEGEPGAIGAGTLELAFAR